VGWAADKGVFPGYALYLFAGNPVKPYRNANPIVGQKTMEQKPFSENLGFRIILVSILIGLGIFFIIYFKDLLKPFVMAVMVWYLIKTIYNYIGKIKVMGRQLPRWLKGALSLAIIFGSVQATINLIITNLSAIVANFSTYQATFDRFLIGLGESLGVVNITDQLQEQLNKLDLQGFLAGTLSSLSTTVGTIVIVVIYIIFLLLEEVAFSKKIDAIFPDRKKRQRIQEVLNEIYESTNKYITLKTGISILTGALSYVVLRLFGVDYAFLWAFLIFIFNYIPYIGSLIATLLPSIFAIVQFGSMWSFLWVFISVEIIQLIVGNYVEPKVMGKSLNLSPLVVVVALSFWGYVWDLLGMFLSVPITSIMLIVLAQFPATRNIAILLTENGNIENILIKKEEGP
ncbi:MAG TPA: AI-2E family transporter, partial [Cyclobacteriaceae bacterium]|nr:AI-2E family transporter [Cyclobacteriaceae bacterium]